MGKHTYTSSDPRRPLVQDPSSGYVRGAGPYQPHITEGIGRATKTREHNVLYGPDGSLRGEQWKETLDLHGNGQTRWTIGDRKQLRAAVAGRGALGALWHGITSFIWTCLFVALTSLGTWMAWELTHEITGSDLFSGAAVVLFWCYTAHILTKR